MKASNKAMPAEFVLDCSVTMAWCFEDQSNSYTDRILSALQEGSQARVPPIWELEVVNVLALTERKQKISRPIANNFKNALTVLPISVDYSANDRVFDTVYELTRELEVTSYDAACLELALRESLPIATQNKILTKAAETLNIAVVDI